MKMKQDSKMVAMIKHPKKMPEKIEIDNELKALQNAVDGHIEHYGFVSGIGIICNEEWRLRGMPLNFCLDDVVFGGPVLFVGESRGELEDLNELQLFLIENFFRLKDGY